MILQLENWHLGYSQVLRDCREQQGSVLILANTDADALAAARILCFMLRSDSVHYQLRPCNNYSSLEDILGQRTIETISAVFLLNLGATKNLTHYASPTMRIFCMDCRRPFHLANVHAGQSVVLFWDQDHANIPSDGDNLSGTESTTASESSDTEEDDDSSLEAEFEDAREEQEEQEFGMEEDAGEVTRVEGMEREASLEREDTDYDGEDEDDGTNDDDDAMDDDDTKPRGDSLPSKLQKTSDDHDDDASMSGDDDNDATPSSEQGQTLSPQELHRQRRDRLRLYYSGGSFYGVPASYVAYLLSTQLRFGEQGDLLWLACVGVTDAYAHARLDVFGYTKLAMELKNHTLRLYPNDMYHRVGNTLYAEHLMGNNNVSTNTSDLTSISLSESGRILVEQDLRFFLLPHTSLYDSMVYSTYVSTHLKLWTARGIQQLQELLAKMGCPLEECRQPFPFMQPALRRTLREKFKEHAEEHGLDNIEFTSFKRITGYKSVLSACDAAYAVTALLECDTPATSEKNDDETIKAFNIAYDALNCNSCPNVILNEGHAVSNLVNGGNMSGNTGIGAGIRLAMSLQKSIVATAVSLVDRKAICTLRHFRYAFITCTSQQSQQQDDAMLDDDDQEDATNVFAKPLALSKLAHYLMDMHRADKKWTGSKSRPLVLAAEKPQTKTYMVVGYEYPEHSGTMVKNRFGQNFELATKGLKGEFRFDSFDSNVVEVNGKDVQKFVEQLHFMMDSM